MDREYFPPSNLPDWLKEFADKHLKKANPFNDIKDLFKMKNNKDEFEERIAELREKVGLDSIEKMAKEEYSGPIEKQTIENENYRKVVFTGKHSQLVLMSLKGGEEIGVESHEVDQFFRIEEGEAIFILDGKKKRIKADEAIIVPAGTEHNVINASDSEPLKLYTIYSPSNHPAGTVEKTKEDAEKEEKRAMLNLISIAQDLENDGKIQEALMVDDKIRSMMDAKDKETKKLPKKYKEYEGLDKFIQNACRTSGGHASLYAIKDRIKKEFEKIDINKELEKYIEFCLEENKEEFNESNEHDGEYIAFVITENDDDDENNKIFDEPKMR